MTKSYAEIALPNAVRQVFTYAVSEEMQANIAVGMRVWVPLGNRKAIGMVVRLHGEKPSFKCKSVSDLLDDKPLLDDELLYLTEWVSQYYFAGWGEVLQAALPSGLNYVAERYLSVLQSSDITKKEHIIFDEIESLTEVLLEEAEKRWGTAIIRKMIEKGSLELREEPKLKLRPKTIKGYTWPDEVREKVLDLLDGLASGLSSNKKRPLWLMELGRLMDFPPPITRKELKEHHSFTDHTLRRIEKEGLIEVVELDVDPSDMLLFEHEPEEISSLNEPQIDACNKISKAIKDNVFESFLLFGITGSGKTEVYIHALKAALEQGKGGLILVPEIVLTPQTVRRFYKIFGDQIAVLHSRLNDRERYEAWLGLRNGTKTIAIGARSAVFSPVQNLGLIILDEEHDQSYKQEDPSPRYHAREVALMRASHLNIPVVLGSATPSMSSLHASGRGKHTFLKLSTRHENAKLPSVQILDLRQYKGAMRGPLTVALYEAIEERLSRKEQIILLNNRRGFAAFLQCESCGDVPECPHCSVSLTFHRSNGTIRCHYCGYSRRAETTCKKCGDDAFTHKGAGTQRNEDDIQEWFPEARILRMDRDTTMRRDSHAKILNAFGNHEADILIGTQLVAKGLDFPNVTLVGVLNADTELAFPSYRSGERMFQLLTQVAGRSGRAEKAGEVYLQTRMPEHESLIHASRHDFESFARVEIEQRRDLFYPPFSRLVQFQFKSDDASKVGAAAECFTNILTRVAKSFLTQAEHRKKYAILGPAPAMIYKLYDDYRWESLIKVDTSVGAKNMWNFLSHVHEIYEKERPAGTSSVRVNVNMEG